MNIPYKNTAIPPERTKAEIEKLLRVHGITDTQWTSYQGETTLRFVWHLTVKGVEKEVLFQFKPPTIEVKKNIYSRTDQRSIRAITQLQAASYRLLFWYLKNKLDAVKYGLESMEKEFLSHAVVSLPNGQQTTVGDSIEAVYESVRSPALTYKPESLKEERIIDL
jgi:hypothetical protein